MEQGVAFCRFRRVGNRGCDIPPGQFLKKSKTNTESDSNKHYSQSSGTTLRIFDWNQKLNNDRIRPKEYDTSPSYIILKLKIMKRSRILFTISISI